MADAVREKLALGIAKRLVDPGFQEMLTAVAPDGSRPIIAALPSDRLVDIAREVDSMGGAANAVVHFLNSYTVVPIKLVTEKSVKKATVAELGARITMGLLIARLAIDAESGEDIVYRIKGEDRPASVGACVAADASC